MVGDMQPRAPERRLDVRQRSLPHHAALLATMFQLVACLSRGDPGVDSAKTPSPAAREFSQRVQQYAELHRRLERLQPPLREAQSAEALNAHRHALADALRDARRNAVPGDIFAPSLAPYFRRIIQADIQDTGTAIVANPAASETPEVRLRVNEDYPDHQPLSSMPPLLLCRLPPLPEELEYRFVGPHLLLLDRQANLIVDFLPAASPPQR
ncbi:MAG: hypothetical protein H6Q33_2874 [Deltaproteobacteria bacterium]|nr:hypothetical protein [Deltaproteobacteria bacterium]